MHVFSKTQTYRIFLISLTASAAIVVLKFFFHQNGWEPIEQSSLHNSVISSAIFVLGFLLSSTISDYKESERIPPEFAANVEDMYSDAEVIHKSYPEFDLEGFRAQLELISYHFDNEVRAGTRGVSDYIRVLNDYFSDMEKAGVPANFIVKLKQQQVLLLRHRKRLTYIQRIHFIPSATILAQSIVVLLISLLVLTNVDPFYGGLAIIGIISFVMVYMLLLIRVISFPFHPEGETVDDVSMFLVKDAERFLRSNKDKTVGRQKK